MSWMSKQTDKILVGWKSISVWRREKNIKHSQGGRAWVRVRVFTFHAVVFKQRTQAFCWLVAVDAFHLISPIKEWQTNNYAVAAAFMSTAICNVVILAGGTRKSALQLLHSSPGPICHADCVPVSTPEAVIYSLLSPAVRAADELGIEPEDGHFSPLTGWTSAAGWISLWARLMDSLRQNRDKLSAFHFLLGRNKTDVRPSEKDSITDITSGGGGEN